MRKVAVGLGIIALIFSNSAMADDVLFLNCKWTTTQGKPRNSYYKISQGSSSWKEYAEVQGYYSTENCSDDSFYTQTCEFKENQFKRTRTVKPDFSAKGTVLHFEETINRRTGSLLRHEWNEVEGKSAPTDKTKFPFEFGICEVGVDMEIKRNKF